MGEAIFGMLLFSVFAEEQRKMYRLGGSRLGTAQGLMGLRQGEQKVAKYAVNFHTRARHRAFFRGLADYTEDKLVSHDVPATLNGVISLAIWTDLYVQARRWERHQLVELELRASLRGDLVPQLRKTTFGQSV